MSRKMVWPYLRISKEDQETIKAISKYPGVLQSADMKDIMMVAAAIAVSADAPALEMPKGGEKTDVANSGALSSELYAEYRQYMILIYYLTAAKRELSNMNDTEAIVENFVDYSHRGLQMMKDSYLKSGGPEEFEKMFAKSISEMKEPLLG